MTKTADLFGYEKPTAPRRKLMKAIDAGEFPDGKSCAEFECSGCGYNSGFVYATPTEIRRGKACPACNET